MSLLKMRLLLFMIIISTFKSDDIINSTCTSYHPNATCKSTSSSLSSSSSSSSSFSYTSSFSSSTLRDLISKRNLTSHFQSIEERDQRKLEHFNKVKRFTNYFVYFNNDYKHHNDHPQSYYYNNNDNNQTHNFFMNNINRCVRYKYSPRLLSPNQISWKSTKTNNDSSNDSINNDNNNTTKSNNNNNKSGEIVHEYLVFAILLPKHPFSSDLYHAIKTVAPMFPSITFVIGDGFEFTEMCQQYNIRSFPKLLFFKKGILKGRYSKEHNAESLAAQLSVWTDSFPRALPNRERRKKDNIEKYFNMWYKYDNIYDKILVLKDWQTITSITNMIRKNIAINIKALSSSSSSHLEPAVGLFDWASSYEIHMIIIAGIYTLLRIIYSFFHKNDDNENDQQVPINT